MPEATYRRCTRCGRTLPLRDFARDATKRTGLRSICKPCDSARKRPAKPRIPATARTCAVCGKHFEANGKQRYCTIACRDRRSRIDRTLTVVMCSHCGKPTAKARRELAKYPKPYCSKSCASRARRREPSTELVGPVRRQVVKVGPSQPIPSTPRRRRVFVSGACTECGTPFLTTRPACFCSDACAKRSHRRQDKKARSKRIHAAARRERIDLATIAHRDNWRCHLCQRLVTRKTWSLDHLIPLSAGGDHTHENVALAHWICNVKRGTRGDVQLRLAA